MAYIPREERKPSRLSKAVQEKMRQEALSRPDPIRDIMSKFYQDTYPMPWDVEEPDVVTAEEP
jgi:hypothetical protein